MELAVIIEGILKATIAQQPWIYYKDALAEKDINILVYQGNDEAFKRPFDAMLLHVWQHWSNKKFFDPLRILPIMEKHAIHRVEFPETVQIILNHKDMSRRPYATPYWRAGDPILYRTPAYDRKELYPFPPDQIWAYEKVWGSPCFVPNTVSKYKSGFIGRAKMWHTSTFREKHLSFLLHDQSTRLVLLAEQVDLQAIARVLQRRPARPELGSVRKVLRIQRGGTMKSWLIVK